MENTLDKDAVNFARLLDAFPTPYMVLKANAPIFTIVAASDAYLSVTQTKREEIKSKPLFEVFPDNPKDNSATGVSDLHTSLNQVIQNGTQDMMGVQRYDVPVGDGSDKFIEKYWSVINTPVFNDKGVVEYIVHRAEDVTEFMLLQKKAEEKEDDQPHNWQLEAEVLRSSYEVKAANRNIKIANEELKIRKKELLQLNERLKEVDRAKTEFFSNISHEFRTPLTLMLGPIEEVLNDSSSSKSVIRNIEVAHRNSVRLLKLVNTLLDFSRLEAGRLQAAFQPTDLAKLTKQLAFHFDSVIEKSGIKLLIRCETLPEPIYVDRDSYEKIVLNLISNAFKHTFKGEIEVNLKWRDNGAILTVRDTGIGIETDQLTKIFERFHRVANAKSRTYEGSGIGLSLVKELVELHHGIINVTSILNEGSVFSVYFPAGKEHLCAEQIGRANPLEVEEQQTLAYTQEAKSWLGNDFVNNKSNHLVSTDKTSEQPRQKILLADDNIDMRNYICTLLDPYYDVTAVTNGLEALKVAKENKPDLILSDVMMPQMTGIELVNQLREDPTLQLIPTILLSARAGEEAKIEGLETGADDYLIKPFKAIELLTRIKTNLRMQKVRFESQEALRKSEEKYQLLYEWEHKIREAIQVLQHNLTEDEVFTKAIQQIGQHLDLEQCYAVVFNENGEPLPVKFEYRKDPKQPSLIGAISEHQHFWQKEFQHSGADENIQKDRYSIFTIHYNQERLGAFVLHQKRAFSQEESIFLSTLIEQLRISLYQAKITAYMERASKLKNQFISNMSHELRTPLNAIIGYSEMILQGMVPSEQAKLKYIGNISISGKHLLALINDILDLSKIEAGKFLLNVREIMLQNFIEELQNILKDLAEKNQVSLKFSIPADLDAIYVDPVRLKQILINLVNNAIKFNRKNGTVHVAVEKSSDGQWSKWKVIDTGIGIPQEKIDDLFTEFYQVDNSSSRAYEGTGLGLALTKKLIQLHGGEITVDSKENIGSTFTFKLPLGDSDEKRNNTDS
jgi:signal transduction histidine kinase/DNA-binding response OmpR family regulator